VITAMITRSGRTRIEVETQNEVEITNIDSTSFVVTPGNRLASPRLNVDNICEYFSYNIVSCHHKESN
jgi:hypothetical protein